MTQNTYIADLEYALNDVNKSYVSSVAYIGINNEESLHENSYFKSMLKETHADEYILQFIETQRNLKKQSLERNFCYQLFFTWQKIITKNQNNTYASLKLNGEVTKANLAGALKSYSQIENKQLFEILKNNSLLDRMHLVPDLVLHGGQDNIDNQKLVVEVKYGSNLKNGNFEIDFYKLAVYQKIFKYEYVVFLIIDITIKDLLEYLSKVDTSVVNKTNLWFMIKFEHSTYSINLNDLI